MIARAVCRTRDLKIRRGKETQMKNRTKYLIAGTLVLLAGGGRVCGMHDAEVSVVQIAIALHPSALT